MDHDVQLLLVGDGPMMQRWRTLANNDRQAGQYICFAGWREDIPPLLKAASIFVMPSRWEGMPNALMEAMAAGCAVVATEVAGCRDLVTDQGNGLLVPPGDVPAMAQAINSLLVDPARADELARQAESLICTRYTLNDHIHAHRLLYREASET